MKAKSKLNFIDRIFLWLNYLLCLVLLLSYLAPVINPVKMWQIAFLGLAYPLILVVNLVMVLYWLLRKKWYVLLSVACILCGWPILKSNIGFHLADKAGAKLINSIRIMTYNVHDFKKYGSNNDISTKHEILQIISEQQPDIIGIQEFYTRKRGQYAMVDSIKKIMQAGYYYFEPIIYSDYDSIGMAIFSKFPILRQGLVRLSKKGNVNQCVFVDVKKGDREFRIYSVHLQSIHFEPEDYKYLDSVSQQGETDMHSTRRLGVKLKNAFVKRAEQVFKIKAHAAQCPYPYVISGDFNDTPSSFAVNQMVKGMQNTFYEKGSGLGRTYNGNFPNYQIDYIMASPQFSVASYKIIEKKLSDHYPVRSDLVFK